MNSSTDLKSQTISLLKYVKEHNLLAKTIIRGCSECTFVCEFATETDALIDLCII